VDLRSVPSDTCPLCKRRALSMSPRACTCLACGSVFEIDPATRHCRYTRVAPAYAQLQPVLEQTWLTRRELFELVETGQLLEPPASEVAGMPTAQEPPTSEAMPIFAPAYAAEPAPEPEIAGAEPSRESAPARRGGRSPAAPLMTMWGVLIGALLLIPILCACLSALLLAPNMARTRQMIAEANALTVVPSATLAAGQATPTLVSALNSPVLTPLTQAAQLTPTAALSPLAETPASAVTLDVVIATSSALPPESVPTQTIEATSVFESTLSPNQPVPQPTDTPPQVDQPTVTLPATFTPVPAASATSIGAESPVATGTPTPSPTLAPGETATNTQTPSVTPPVSPVSQSTVMIAMVMYLGDTNRNEADEYVELQNRGQEAANLSSWTLHSVSSGKLYTFPNGFSILPAQVCRIYTNSPSEYGGCGALSFGSDSPVWSNTGDIAELRDSAGNLMFSYPYGTLPTATLKP
jgi:hypothetical protein